MTITIGKSRLDIEYQLPFLAFRYEVWGNHRDGYDVNNRYGILVFNAGKKFHSLERLAADLFGVSKAVIDDSSMSEDTFFATPAGKPLGEFSSLLYSQTKMDTTKKSLELVSNSQDIISVFEYIYGDLSQIVYDYLKPDHLLVELDNGEYSAVYMGDSIVNPRYTNLNIIGNDIYPILSYTGKVDYDC